jgi:hypothetical protein
MTILECESGPPHIVVFAAFTAIAPCSVSPDTVVRSADATSIVAPP